MVVVALPEAGIETLFGPQDENLKRIEKAYRVAVSARGQEIRVSGADAERVSAAEALLRELTAILERGYRFRSGDVATAIRVRQDSPELALDELFLAAQRLFLSSVSVGGLKS